MIFPTFSAEIVEKRTGSVNIGLPGFQQSLHRKVKAVVVDVFVNCSGPPFTFVYKTQKNYGSTGKSLCGILALLLTYFGDV